MAAIVSSGMGCSARTPRPLREARDLKERIEQAEEALFDLQDEQQGLENELAACRRCNGERGHRTPGEWFDECERRGWNPNRDAIVGALGSLERAIGERGGQRRARPYIASQLRRLRV